MIAALAFLSAAARDLMSLTLIGAVRCYQLLLSPLMGGRCRFQPSCSAYAILAVRRYGPLVGAWMTVGRLLRCHPWHPGGWDPP